MRRYRVKSSSIVSVGYDAKNAILELEFGEGRLYQYFDVPRATYEALLRAPSVGRFVNTGIKGVFRCLPLKD
jgi:hypothetical protein